MNTLKALVETHVKFEVVELVSEIANGCAGRTSRLRRKQWGREQTQRGSGIPRADVQAGPWRGVLPDYLQVERVLRP